MFMVCYEMAVLFLHFQFLGPSGYKGTEAKMGVTKSGKSDNKHIQTVPGQGTTEEVKSK